MSSISDGWIAVIQIASFQDFLSNLVGYFFQAKEMVNLSKMIANKIKDKQGEISEDEVII